MASRRAFRFTGLRRRDLFGIFDVVRGYANIFDLAAASSAVPLIPDWNTGGEGYQRTIDDEHVAAIRRFLESGRYRFFPELVFGLRIDPDGDDSVRIHDQADDYCAIEVARGQADRLHRIDGNHRLEAATQIIESSRGSRPPYSEVPFCFVLLSPGSTDDITEAMLFNLINSKALPMVSEHSLTVLMQDEGSAAERYAEDPQLFMTRCLRDVVAGWPRSFYESMGSDPLSQLHETAAVLLASANLAAADHRAAERTMKEMFEPLSDIASRLSVDMSAFVSAPAFLPIAAHVFATQSGPGGEAEAIAMRTREAERWLREFGRWYLAMGGPSVSHPANPTLLWDVFKAQYDRRGGRVFVAASFARADVLEEVGQAIDEAISAFNAGHPAQPLTVGRADRQRGASYEVPAWIFEEISRSRLMIADLTDERPNVYLEVGFALSRGIPVILTFHRRTGTPPWDRTDDAGNRVAFDIAAFRYVGYDSGMQLRGRLAEELEAFFAQEEQTPLKTTAVESVAPLDAQPDSRTPEPEATEAPTEGQRPVARPRRAKKPN